MAKIKMTNGKDALMDEEDKIWLTKYFDKWHPVQMKDGIHAGTIVNIDGDDVCFLMENLIVGRCVMASKIGGDKIFKDGTPNKLLKYISKTHDWSKFNELKKDNKNKYAE